jgi:hypothetical protein
MGKPAISSTLSRRKISLGRERKNKFQPEKPYRQGKSEKKVRAKSMI